MSSGLLIGPPDGKDTRYILLISMAYLYFAQPVHDGNGNVFRYKPERSSRHRRSLKIPLIMEAANTGRTDRIGAREVALDSSRSRTHLLRLENTTRSQSQ